MNNLDAILEVAIGLVFVWMILSAATMEAQNIVARLFQTRANFLEQMISDMFHGNNEYIKAFFQHPAIQELHKKGIFNRNKRPDYIPNPLFSEVALDVFINLGNEDVKSGSVSVGEIIDRAEAISKEFDASIKRASEKKGSPFAKMLNKLFPKAMGRQELHAKTKSGFPYAVQRIFQNFDSEYTFSRARHYEARAADLKHNAEKWFDESMIRASFWYKEKAKTTAFIIGVALALSLNIDTIGIAQELWRDPTLRQSLVAKAQAQEASPEALSVSELKDEYKALNLPLGWSIEALFESSEEMGFGEEVAPKPLTSCELFSWGSESDASGEAGIDSDSGNGLKNNLIIKKNGACYKVLGIPASNDYWGWGAKSIGILLSAVAAMQGAPFWFDMLRKILDLGGKSKKEDKKKEEEKEEAPVG